MESIPNSLQIIVLTQEVLRGIRRMEGDIRKGSRRNIRKTVRERAATFECALDLVAKDELFPSDSF